MTKTDFASSATPLQRSYRDRGDGSGVDNAKRSMSRRWYDLRCWQLAEYFLVAPATEAQRRALASRIADLAQHIQDAVEAWLAAERDAIDAAAAAAAREEPRP